MSCENRKKFKGNPTCNQEQRCLYFSLAFLFTQQAVHQNSFPRNRKKWTATGTYNGYLKQGRTKPDKAGHKSIKLKAWSGIKCWRGCHEKLLLLRSVSFLECPLLSTSRLGWVHHPLAAGHPPPSGNQLPPWPALYCTDFDANQILICSNCWNHYYSGWLMRQTTNNKSPAPDVLCIPGRIAPQSGHSVAIVGEN